MRSKHLSWSDPELTSELTPTDIEYRIIRRPRRRTACVQVSPDNQVTIIVPANLSQAKIADIIRRKTPWIIKKMKFNDAVRHPVKPKEYVSGEAFSYLGRNYRLKVLHGKPRPVELKNGRFFVHVQSSGNERENHIRGVLTAWYKSHALDKLADRARLYADRVGVSYRAVRVKDLKSRWGSCTMAGDIHFTWHIIMAPMRIVDYVVVHELCHRAHHNHSPAFWRLLGRILPDYRAHKEWLRINGPRLTV